MQRTEATIRGPSGQTFRVTKGAAHAVLGLVQTNKEIIASSVNQKVRTSAAASHIARHRPIAACAVVPDHSAAAAKMTLSACA